MYTDNYEQEIDLKDLFFTLLYRWRLLLIAAVVGAALLGGYKGLKGSQPEAVVGTEDSYEEKMAAFEDERSAFEKTIEALQNSINAQNNYIAEAPLMQINPYNEAVSTADVLIERDGSESYEAANLMESYRYSLLDGEYIEKAASDLGTQQRYLKELLTIEGESEAQAGSREDKFVFELHEANLEKGILHISAVGTDSAMTDKLLSAVLEEIEVLHTTFAKEIGNHSVTVLRKTTGEKVDTAILAQQQAVRDNVATLQKSLDDFTKSADELAAPVNTDSTGISIKSGIKYAALGFVAGGFVAVVILCIAYVLNDKVSADKEVKSRFGLKGLGSFSRVPKKRALDFIDSWLRQLAGDNAVWPDEAVYEMIVTNIRNYAGDKRRLFVTGMSSKAVLEGVSQRLESGLRDYIITSECDMVANASARRKMAEAEGIILVEERNVSRYSHIQQELEIAGNVGMEVIGVIVK